MSLYNTPSTQRRQLNASVVRRAYKRWAPLYDTLFGTVSKRARMHALALLNTGQRGSSILEVGVGTGLSLPHYRPDFCITGVDYSFDMLERARSMCEEKLQDRSITLIRMDAQHMGAFRDNVFDVAAIMFVASVVPEPARMMMEVRRVVRHNGRILILNHFLSNIGWRRWIELKAAPLSHTLGWHPDFRLEELLTQEEMRRATLTPCPPRGLFTLVSLVNKK